MDPIEALKKASLLELLLQSDSFALHDTSGLIA